MKSGDSINTKKVYIGKVYEVESTEDVYFRMNVNLTYVGDVLLIVKKDIFGRKYMKDLNSGKKYNVKLPIRIGTLYVSRRYLKSFNAELNNEIINLPKSKILELGNKYIKANKEK